MKILHINCNYIGTTLHQLMVEQLDALGYENRVFVPTYDRDLAVIQPNPNVCVCECFRKWDRLAFDYKQKKIRKGLEANIPLSGFDWIHAYTLFTDGNCARNLSKQYGIPYVVAVRNTDVNAFFKRMPHLRKRGVEIMLDAEAVFFLSEAYRRQVFEKYVPQQYRDAIRRKSHIIPNGIDEFWFQNPPAAGKECNGKPLRLIYAGRIDANKNIPTTQKAMALLRDQGYAVTLTVVGKVEDKKVYQCIQQDSDTTCLPAMPKEKLIEAYRNADIFVMPSFTESFGLVYAEAMSQGLPVVYSKGQGFDGQFPEGMVGYPVDAASPQSVAEGIRRVVENYSQIQKNVVDASRNFQWAKIVTRYDAVYQRVSVETG